MSCEQIFVFKNISEWNSVLREDVLQQLEGWHLFALKLWVFKVTVHVDLKSTALHQLGLNNWANEEEHHSCLHLVLAKVLHNVLQEIWCACWAEEAQNSVSHKHQTEEEHPNISDDWWDGGFGASHNEWLSRELHVGHCHLIWVWRVFLLLVVVVNQLALNQLLHLHKGASVRSPDTVHRVHLYHIVLVNINVPTLGVLLPVNSWSVFKLLDVL